MIGKIKRISGKSGGPLNYILGGKQDKDQAVTVVEYNGFCLSNKMIQEIERVPKSKLEREIHKKLIWNYVQILQQVFDNRAALADSRVKDPFESYILGYSPEDLPMLTSDLRKTICKEFLERMGVYGNSDKLCRDAIFLACSHKDTNAPHEHIITCRIDENGKANDITNDYWKALKVARSISKKYHLHMRLNNKEITEENGYTLCEEHYERDVENCNSYAKAQSRVLKAVRESYRNSLDFEDFCKKIKRYNVDVDIEIHSETGEEYGIIFREKKSNIPFAGSDIKRAYSYPNLKRHFAENKALIERIGDLSIFYPKATEINKYTVRSLNKRQNNVLMFTVDEQKCFATVIENKVIVCDTPIGKQFTDLLWRDRLGNVYKTNGTRLTLQNNEALAKKHFGDISKFFPDKQGIRIIGPVLGNAGTAVLKLRIGENYYFALKDSKDIYVSSEYVPGKTDRKELKWRNDSGQNFTYDAKRGFQLITPTKEIQTTHSQAIQEGESEYDKLVMGKRGIKM